MKIINKHFTVSIQNWYFVITVKYILAKILYYSKSITIYYNVILFCND